MGELRIQLVGPFTVVRAGRVLSGEQVGSRKARTLLAVLALARGRFVPADAVVAAVWPESPPRRPAQGVATLVSRIRGTLGADAVLGGRACYRLGDGTGVDLHEATRRLVEAEAALAGEPATALTAAREAVAVLAAAPLLTDEPDAGWVRAARADQAEAVRRSRRVLAAAALRVGEAAVARDAAAAGCADDPFDEEACRALMRAYDALGEPARALTAYDRLRTALADELGVDPAPATQGLQIAILRSGTPEIAVPEGLVGRDGDLARLRDAWRAAGAGRGGLVLISGDPGIGKTRLADEVARAAARVLAVRCYEAERSLFLQPVVEALTALVGTLPADRIRAAAADRAGPLAALVPEIAALLDDAPDEHGTPEAHRRRTYDAVVTFLRRLSRAEPVLLVLDDLQNAGAATVELLHYLARHVGDARLLVVATVRAGEGAWALSTLRPFAEVVELRALDRAAITRLATAAGQGKHAEQLERRTRGHPLFVVESLRALAAGESGVPESLRAGVLARVARAGEQAEELLRAAAVLGSSFSPVTVAGLLSIGVEEAVRRCERLLPTRLAVVAGRSYEFANDLMREILYDSTPAPTRLAHHLRAADLLAGNPESVARHAEAAGDDRRASRAWLAAGARAARRYATADAEALFSQAIVAADRAGEAELLGRGHLSRGQAREAGFRYREALADYQVAVRTSRQIGERRLEMAALHRLGGPAWGGSGLPVDEGVGHLRAALRLAEQLADRGAEARMLGWLAIVRCNQLRFDEAFAHGRRAQQAARASGDEGALLAVLDARKTTHAYLGEVAELSAVLAELEPRVRHAGDLWLLQWCVFESAFPQIAAGRWTRAEQLINEAAAINARSGYHGYAAWYVAHLGWLARLAGRPADALALGRRAVTMDSHAWFVAAVHAMCATTLLEAGERSEAIGLLERGLTIGATQGTSAYRLRCLAPLAEATGSPELLEEADAALRAIGSAWLYGSDAYVSVARAWLDRGEPGRARAILGPLLDASERTGWVAPLATARELYQLRCNEAAISPVRLS